MKIAIVAGIVVPNDAISAAVVSQAAVLLSMTGVESVDVFAQNVARPLPCSSHVIANGWDLVQHRVFEAADVAIFHWGIRYELFDALTLLAGLDRPIGIVHFHNCTPEDLVPESSRPVIQTSMRQIAHVIASGTTLWTFSEYNMRTLLEWGAVDSQILFVPFEISMPDIANRARPTDRLEILTVGRMVSAKGIHVLIEAIGLLSEDARKLIRVRIAGSKMFSDAQYVCELEDRILELDLNEVVAFIDNPSDESLQELFSEADVVVSPSFHEGLCVPVIEAYSYGCRVIGTTAGNLPFLILPCDVVVEPGNAPELARALEDTIAIGKVLEIDERRVGAAHKFGRKAVIAALNKALDPTGP